MEEAKTIDIECIELQSHSSFSNMSTLLVANEHPSWMKLKSKRYLVFLSLIVVWYLYTWLGAVYNTKIPNKY